MKRIYLSLMLTLSFYTYAQTEIDGIMMSKNNFCVGAVYQYSSWDQYWEGTFKRENLNLGTVSNKSLGIMGNYGISDQLNVLFSVPYVATKASAGTMEGQKGIQDLSLTVKYMPLEKTVGKATYSLYALAGFSAPLSNYTADYLPLSIGLKSKTASLRLMGDYQRGHFFTTLSGAYVKKANITIDRDSYYTTEIHYTNEVDIPDAISVNVRMGYRSNRLIAEFVFDNWVTQSGGFDITSNNMPFPSNTMNATRLGVNTKYTLKKLPALSAVAGCSFVTDGRNVGQSNTFYGGIFYVINFKTTTK